MKDDDNIKRWIKEAGRMNHKDDLAERIVMEVSLAAMSTVGHQKSWLRPIHVGIIVFVAFVCLICAWSFLGQGANQLVDSTRINGLEWMETFWAPFESLRYANLLNDAEGYQMSPIFGYALTIFALALLTLGKIESKIVSK